MNFFKIKRKTDIVKEKQMQYFSQEYRDALVNEHKLVSASILKLSENFRNYIAHHTAEVVTKTLSDLKTKKVELEAKIDCLDEFLNG